MDFNTQVKLAIYRHFADSGSAPTVGDVAGKLGVEVQTVRRSFAELRAVRVLFLEPDGDTIRMAPPFSGVPTDHVVTIQGKRYFANCAWDSLGIPAALHAAARVHSHCAQTGEPLDLEIGVDGPAPSGWVFHSLVRASQWWQDIVFT